MKKGLVTNNQAALADPVKVPRREMQILSPDDAAHLRKAVEELRRHKAKQSEEHMARGLGRDRKALVVCRKDGEPLQPRSLTHEFARMAAGLRGIPRVRFHDLRHSHISRLPLAGEHPKVAQERAGHSSFQITMDTYSHLMPTMQAQAAKSIDTILRTAIEQKDRK